MYGGRGGHEGKSQKLARPPRRVDYIEGFSRVFKPDLRCRVRATRTRSFSPSKEETKVLVSAANEIVSKKGLRRPCSEEWMRDKNIPLWC